MYKLNRYLDRKSYRDVCSGKGKFVINLAPTEGHVLHETRDVVTRPLRAAWPGRARPTTHTLTPLSSKYHSLAITQTDSRKYAHKPRPHSAPCTSWYACRTGSRSRYHDAR